MNEYSRISALKGVGDKTEQLFQKLNIETVGDLLRYYPRKYDIYEEATPIADVGQNQLEKPSPKMNANTTTCWLTPRRSASGTKIGIKIAALP